jgi:light-regulated signal transduction histidine kinase (bacteriophytochrome)
MDVFLKERNAEIIIKDNLPEMLCNNKIIAELFRNLIVNGVIYNLSEEKNIIIRYKNTRLYHKFSIKDNGIGIKEEYYKTVFEPFKGLHAKEQFEEGTGLGLTLVKKIIDLHNGKIWIKSKVDKGTIFYFNIPKSYGVVKSANI